MQSNERGALRAIVLKNLNRLRRVACGAPAASVLDAGSRDYSPPTGCVRRLTSSVSPAAPVSHSQVSKTDTGAD
jgi:hypothetical protein